MAMTETVGQKMRSESVRLVKARRICHGGSFPSRCAEFFSKRARMTALRSVGFRLEWHLGVQYEWYRGLHRLIALRYGDFFVFNLIFYKSSNGQKKGKN